MRILGIDYGIKRIGLALSDETLTIATPYAIVSPQEFRLMIEGLLVDKEVEQIVVGLPLNMSGGQTVQTQKTLQFVEILRQQTHLPIELMDERLSSTMAENVLGTKKNLDAQAAQIILQNYLDKSKNK